MTDYGKLELILKDGNKQEYENAEAMCTGNFLIVYEMPRPNKRIILPLESIDYFIDYPPETYD